MNISNGLCNMCCKDRETLIHLFWECEKIKPIWVKIQDLINGVAEIIEINERFSFSKVVLGYTINSAKIFNTIIFETKWHIWKFRNDFKFSQRHPSLLACQKQLIRNIKDQYLFQNIKNENKAVLKYILDYKL